MSEIHKETDLDIVLKSNFCKNNTLIHIFSLKNITYH